MYNFENCIIRENVDMCEYTSFKTGGRAKVMIEPQSADALEAVLKELSSRGEEYYVLGNGTNLLVADEGIEKPVIHIGKAMSNITIEGDCLICEAGALLSAAAQKAYKHSLTGMEFAHGIPGSIGGAVCMNAGAYGGEMKDIVLWVEYVTSNGDKHKVTGEAAGFRYRGSVFSDNSTIVTRVCLKLNTGNSDEILSQMKLLAEKRRSKQPLEYPSAGSTFKRPEGYFAAALIEEAGLKGVSVGGAQVSEKHSGFVINKGGATTGDVLMLMDEIKKVVKEKSGVILQPEVKIWR